jgi:hypothetical protein
MPRRSTLFYRAYFFLTGISLSLFLSGLLLFFQKPLAAQVSAPTNPSTGNKPTAQTTLPTVQYSNTLFPDWEKITLSSFPGLGSSGQFDPQQQPDNSPGIKVTNL